ncbi:uncharacterized protein LOC123291018 [Chrysoperla carnea]|uniref:uncharacterized protein LOC123291018 n=1 Tax=Chrysoperla carnea TaxID=189513 RepID=UPI001D07A00D|nr:uncharacterized protein LOC123291018 [Chrysoperla carnea]
MPKFSRMKIRWLIFAMFASTIEVIGASSMFGPGFPFNNDFGGNMRKNMDAQMGNMRRNMENMPGRRKIFSDVMPPEFYESMNRLQQQMDDMNAKFEATRLISSMLKGTGGSTRISYNGNNVLVHNNQMTGCQGQVFLQPNNGFVCNGIVVGANKVCVPGSKSFSQINDRFCVFDDTALSHSSYEVNGQIICENGVLYTLNELQKQCGTNVMSEQYAHAAYTPDLNNPQHIPIPSNNPYLNCQRTDVCEFDINFSGFKNFF